MRRLLCLALALCLLCGCSLAENATERPASGVTYEIFAGSFADGNGDGLGDLQGVMDHLDYIASLGVSRIWLTPIHPSPSYHRYDVTDYYAVDPALGSLEDFDQLVASSAEHGIDIVMDLVVNHTSAQHPWFLQACDALRRGADSPYISWYHFTQGEGQHQVSGTDWYYEGSFGAHMPDLNLKNDDVRAEIARILAFWQSRGVKGFRLDAVTSYFTGASASTAEFLSFLTQTARQNDPDAYLVGEAWTDEASILALYQSGVDSLFNFPAADQNGVFIRGALGGRGAAVASTLADYNAKLREASPSSLDAPFLTNHDLARARGMLRSNVPKMKTAAMLYLLLPGRPVVYYGEELGMSGSGRDENKRLPMLWSGADASLQCLPPADADQQQRLKTGVIEQNDDPDSLLNTYRALIHLRAQAPELERGVMTALDAGNDAVCAFLVEDGDAAVAVLVNASGDQSVSVALSALELSGATALGQVGNVSLSADTLTLSPVSCILLRVK